METKNTYIDFEEYLKREQYFKDMKAQGVSFYFKRNWFKLSVGVGCIVMGIIPNGLGIIFYPLGFYLLGISTADLFIYKERFKRWLKFKLRMIYVKMTGGKK